MEKQQAFPTAELKRALQVMAPSMLGLMIARSGMIVSTYGGYSSTDSGIMTDGSSLVATTLTVILMLYVGMSRVIIPKTYVRRTAYATFALQGASMVGLGLCMHFQAPPWIVALLAIVVTLSFYMNLFYWLRRARGTTSAVAVIYAFGALALSEPLIFVMSLAPGWVACLVMGIAVFLQFPCALAARKRPLLAEVELGNDVQGYFGVAAKMLDSIGFLAVTAVGVFILSFAIGILRGYQDGSAVAFSLVTRVGYAVFEIALFLWFIIASLRGRRSVMTYTVWILMQGLGCAALILYTVLPGSLDVGAVFTTVMNATMTGFVWYLIIAFSSHGSNDPYYYAIAGHTVFMLSRSVARVATMFLLPLFEGDDLVIVVIGSLILVSAQAVFLGFLFVSRTESQEAMENASHLRRLLGLEESAKDPATMRRVLVERNTAQMKAQFMLSDRETEVLTLYALGLTQSKIAEQLCITQGTTHTHIKRIYAKTDLHSRQEILDYIERYTQ